MSWSARLFCALAIVAAVVYAAACSFSTSLCQVCDESTPCATGLVCMGVCVEVDGGSPMSQCDGPGDGG
jgi:hypothetical protein